MPRDLKVGVLRVFAEKIRSLGERIAAFTEPDGVYPRALGRIPSPLYRSSGEKTKEEQTFAYLADVRAPRRRSRTFRKQKRCQGVRHNEKGRKVGENRKEENIGGVAVKGQKRCFRAPSESAQYVRKAAGIPIL